MAINVLIPASRGISLALARKVFISTSSPLFLSHRNDFDVKDITADNQERIHLINVDVCDEETIREAAYKLKDFLTAGKTVDNLIISPGILTPERRLEEIDYQNVLDSFKINVIGPMFVLKHFGPLLSSTSKTTIFAARVGSVSENRLGGWFSYRSSKAAVFQLVKSANLYYQQKHRGICIGYHPGTVKTGLSKGFWESKGIMEPDEAAAHAWDVIRSRSKEHGGKVWDWKGVAIPP